MIDSATSGGVYTDFEGLAKLRLSAARNDPKAVEAVARQFEGVFLQMLLKSMRATVPEGGGLSGPMGSGIERDLFDSQLALELAASGQTGIAALLTRELRESAPAEPAEATDTRALALPPRTAFPPPALAIRSPDEAQSPSSTRLASRTGYESPAAFVETLRPLADRAATALGADPDLILAQAALESGWGRSVIRRPDGQSSHNFFGLKADGRWSGDSVRKSTLEFKDGVAHREQAAFRAYASAEEGFADYVDFLASQPRYREVLEAETPDAFARRLQQAGYATDPRYAEKIIDIHERIRREGPVARVQGG